MTDAPAAQWVPEGGTSRLAETAQGRCFTSDLSVDEFVLVRESGFVPLGLVMGTSMYHVGLQFAGWEQSMELTVLSQAMYSARELAIERMVAEAVQLDADGIVGVDLRMVPYEGGADVLEFLAVGTAVRSEKAPGSFQAPGGRPFSSGLSGRDFFKLLRYGWSPTALVLGSCVYHVAHQSIRQAMKQFGQNVEIPLYTQAVYAARELAMARMQAEGERSGAAGIVGVTVKEYNHVWGEYGVEFLAVGTGVRKAPTETASGLAFTVPV
ncbi:MAG: heavy metal-binding domain-containing protein [Candidatus Dormibacteria bacterium]